MGGDRLAAPGGSITFGSFAERTGLPTTEEETRTIMSGGERSSKDNESERIRIRIS